MSNENQAVSNNKSISVKVVIFSTNIRGYLVEATLIEEEVKDVQVESFYVCDLFNCPVSKDSHDITKGEIIRSYEIHKETQHIREEEFFYEG